MRSPVNNQHRNLALSPRHNHLVRLPHNQQFNLHLNRLRNRPNSLRANRRLDLVANQARIRRLFPAFSPVVNLLHSQRINQRISLLGNQAPNPVTSHPLNHRHNLPPSLQEDLRHSHRVFPLLNRLVNRPRRLPINQVVNQQECLRVTRPISLPISHHRNQAANHPVNPHCSPHQFLQATLHPSLRANQRRNRRDCPLRNRLLNQVRNLLVSLVDDHRCSLQLNRQADHQVNHRLFHPLSLAGNLLEYHRDNLLVNHHRSLLRNHHILLVSQRDNPRRCPQHNHQRNPAAGQPVNRQRDLVDSRPCSHRVLRRRNQPPCPVSNCSVPLSQVSPRFKRSVLVEQTCQSPSLLARTSMYSFIVASMCRMPPWASLPSRTRMSCHRTCSAWYLVNVHSWCFQISFPRLRIKSIVFLCCSVGK